MVDDLYKKVKERDENNDTNKIERLNEECLELVNKALDIKWENYR